MNNEQDKMEMYQENNEAENYDSYADEADDEESSGSLIGTLVKGALLVGAGYGLCKLVNGVRPKVQEISEKRAEKKAAKKAKKQAKKAAENSDCEVEE